jgi:hypothetical protein
MIPDNKKKKGVKRKNEWENNYTDENIMIVLLELWEESLLRRNLVAVESLSIIIIT